MRSKILIAVFALGHIASHAKASQVVGGAPDSRDAVVWVSSAAGRCTGTYIAPGLVLTAAHCVPEGDIAPAAVLVGFVDAAQSAPDTVLASHRVARFATGEPLLDLAVVVLDDRHVPARVHPIAVLPPELALGGDDVGRSVVLVGFGAQRPPGATPVTDSRQSGPSTLAAVEPERLTVASAGTQARACFGDSGGPLLISRGDVEYVAGVLSTGAADCSGIDHHVRVDAGRGAQFVDDESQRVAGAGCSSAGGGTGSGSALLATILVGALRLTRRWASRGCAARAR